MAALQADKVVAANEPVAPKHAGSQLAWAKKRCSGRTVLAAGQSFGSVGAQAAKTGAEAAKAESAGQGFGSVGAEAARSVGAEAAKIGAEAVKAESA